MLAATDLAFSCACSSWLCRGKDWAQDPKSPLKMTFVDGLLHIGACVAIDAGNLLNKA